MDLLGRVAFSIGKGSISAGPGQGADLFTGTEDLLARERTIFGLPSRNPQGTPNIVVMLRDLRNQFHMRESIDVVVTEYGIANLKWRTIPGTGSSIDRYCASGRPAKTCRSSQEEEDPVLGPDFFV